MECALDDFGTGYSSLTFLKQLTAHTIKIDQSFVRGMLDDAEHATLVSSVLDLARNFSRRALAEGIETEAHGQALIEFGCEFGQGYAIARPMPADAVSHWMSKWRVPDAWAQSEAVEQRDIPVLLAEVAHRASTTIHPLTSPGLALCMKNCMPRHNSWSTRFKPMSEPRLLKNSLRWMR